MLPADLLLPSRCSCSSPVLPSCCRDLLQASPDLLRFGSEVLPSQSELLLSSDKLLWRCCRSGCCCSGRQGSPGSSERRSRSGSEGLVACRLTPSKPNDLKRSNWADSSESAQLLLIRRLARCAVLRSIGFRFFASRSAALAQLVAGSWRRDCLLATQLKEPRLC